MMEIQPDLSIALSCQPEADMDLSPCLQALAACVDPVSVEIFVSQEATGWQPWQEQLHIQEVDVADVSFLAQAWSAASGRYLASWNSSILAGPSCLMTLLDFLDDNPDVGAVGPRFFSEQGDILPTALAFTNPFTWQDRPPLGWDGLASQEVGWLSNAALLVNSLAVAEVGLPQTGKDFWSRDYCRRLRKQGWHISFCHLARVTATQPLAPLPTLGRRLRALL